jgi:3-hydroxypropanoate dehydrogenase
MTHTTVNDSTVADLPRLDDHGRAVLFTQARTANSFSDRPVTEDQLKEIYE